MIIIWVSGVRDARSNEEFFELAPYFVESTRLQSDWMEVSQSLTVVGKSRIQLANQQITLDESLLGVPGVFILNPFNYAQDTRISIRGFGARADFGIRGIRLIIDGIPATTPDGQGEVDGMDLGSTGRIEVLRGPGAAYHGAASGGVILIDTEDGPDDPFVETRLTAGDFGLLHWQFKTGGQQGPLNYMISGGHLDSDGYRNRSETENTRLNGKLRYQLSGGDALQLVFNIIDFPLQNDPGGLTRQEAAANPRQASGRNVLYDSGESVAQQRVGLEYEKHFDTTRSLELILFHTHRDFSNRLPFASGGQVGFERQFSGSRIVYKYSGERSRFGTGLDLDYQDDRRRNYDNLVGTRGPLVLDQDERVRSIGVFMAYEAEISERLHVSSALRYDDVAFKVSDALLADGDDSGDISFSEISPSLGFTWSLSDAAVLYANASRSFETPTTTEFDNPLGGGFNTGLESQQAASYEIGSRGWIAAGDVVLEYSIALFHIDIEDALVPFELPQFPGREFYRNAGESTRRGLELQVQANLGSGFSVGLDYTWSDFSYDAFVTDGADYSGMRIPGIPRHFGSLFLNYESESGFFTSWHTRFVGSFFANDANTDSIHSYTTSDLRLGYRIERADWTIEPFLAVNNIFDQSYFANVRINAFGGRHFEPAPCRYFHGGIRLRYGF